MARNTVGPVLLAVTLLWGTGSCQGGQPSARETAGGNLDTGVHGDRVKRSDDPNTLETLVAQLSQEVTSLRAQQEADRNELQTVKNDVTAQLQTVKQDIQADQGSTFIRWGRTSCPSASHTVYSGVVGGSWYNDEGGSGHRLCLSLQPEFDAINHHRTYYSKIFGAEYEHIGDLHNHDVPCAVCKAAQTTTLMIPGIKTCPAGWVVQYWGHITGNHYDDHGAAEYLCVDSSPVSRGYNGDQNGAKFLYTVTECGSLPCPPYINSRVVTCVVCSQ